MVAPLAIDLNVKADGHAVDEVLAPCERCGAARLLQIQAGRVTVV